MPQNSISNAYKNELSKDEHKWVIQDHTPPTHFKPKKVRKLNLGGNGDEQSRIEVFCDNGEASTVAPLPDNAATME